ncbi:hypothetical protein RMATCC62417_02555 [Rhizopus microsporus]|nr:hypothetical protein RMATCC62417_02555 [Rhizopus microsporus]
MCWKSMLEAAFRGTSIKTARGETASDAFKFDKLLNKSEFGSSKETTTSNSKQLAEIGSIEIKSAADDRSTEIIQLNKNTRVKKSILCSLCRHSGPHLDSPVATLGLDIVGYTETIYMLKPRNPAISTKKISAFLLMNWTLVAS